MSGEIALEPRWRTVGTIVGENLSPMLNLHGDMVA